MSQQTFADLGVSNAVCTALNDRGFAAPFAIQTKVIGDVLAGRDVLAKSPTGSGKTLAFMVPIVDRIEATDRRPAALVLAPTRELATQIVEASYPIAHARALKVRAVYGGVGIEKQAREARTAHIIVATPGPPRGPDPARRPLARARADPRPRRGRPHARHGLPPAGRPHRRPVPGRPPDAVLLRDARRRGRRDRRASTRASPVTHEHVPPVAEDRRHRAPLRPRRGRRPHRHAARSSCAAPSTSWRSSSCAPSAAPTASSSAWATRATRRSRCTATRASASARRRSRSSSPAASTRSSPPTSPPAASTSTASRTSSTSTRRRTARATCTASAAPAAPAAPASASRSSAASTPRTSRRSPATSSSSASSRPPVTSSAAARRPGRRQQGGGGNRQQQGPRGRGSGRAGGSGGPKGQRRLRPHQGHRVQRRQARRRQRQDGRVRAPVGPPRALSPARRVRVADLPAVAGATPASRLARESGRVARREPRA